MPSDRARAILQADAVFHGLLGALLLLGSWNALYEALQLPRLQPALFAQLGATAVLAYAFVLWTAAGDARLTVRLALAAALANGVALLLLLAWLVGRWEALRENWGVGGFGKGLLIVLALVLAGLTVAQAWIVLHARGERQPAARLAG